MSILSTHFFAPIAVVINVVIVVVVVDVFSVFIFVVVVSVVVVSVAVVVDVFDEVAPITVAFLPFY